MVREGLFYVLVPGALMVVFLIMGFWPVAILFGLLAAFMAFFFRDPSRLPPADPGVVVAPADGRVTRVQSIQDGNAHSATLVSIFLSPLDVHINRAPIAGKIIDVSYAKGRFLMATDERASLVNEQNKLTIEGEQITVECTQIAGILARRIVCWKRVGERLKLGERFGMIKFSSRTDLLLPENIEVVVKKGNRVQGGITIIGRLR